MDIMSSRGMAILFRRLFERNGINELKIICHVLARADTYWVDDRPPLPNPLKFHISCNQSAKKPK